MSPTPRKFKRPGDAPLPKPNVEFAAADDGEMTPEKVRAMFCNPLYTGIAHVPKVVDDETWVHAAAQAIREHGSEQWLVNMLYVLQKSLGNDVPASSEE